MPVTVDGVTLGTILQDVSFELAEGTITLLVGQTGAGKSSLLDVLTGLNRFDGGAVDYDGVPLWDGKRVHAQVLKEIGVVFQFPEHQLFARTVQGEFDYSLKPLGLGKAEATARTLAALREVGLPEEMTAASPLVLSGGQKRRVALATTFATAPKWLFLDEPTAGLDPQAVERLVEFLQSFKRQTTGGIIIATHDLDAFFPIADRVLLLDRGRLAAFSTPQELCAKPQLLRQARVGLPSSTTLSQAFAQKGIRLTPFSVTPDEMADEILKQLKTASDETDRHKPKLLSDSSHIACKPDSLPDSSHIAYKPDSLPDSSHIAYKPDSLPDSDHSVGEHSQSLSQSAAAVAADAVEQETKRRTRLSEILRTLDPRAKWAFYLLVSLGVLVQTSWLGLALATGVTALCMGAAGMWKRDVWRMMKPFLYFILFSIALSGLRFGDGISFEIGAAEQTMRQLYKFLLLMLLGIWLSTTTSQLMMKQGLEVSLAPLKKLKLPVEAFALATSLMLRFVPVIMQELRRFSRITKARGKSAKGTLRFRDIGAVIVPLLLSVLRLGEDLSIAMEARGYAKFGNRRTSSVKLRMVQSDRIILLAGVVLFSVLLAASYLESPKEPFPHSEETALFISQAISSRNLLGRRSCLPVRA